MRRAILCGALLAATVPASATAQTGRELLDRAVTEYRNLRLDLAAGFLRRALYQLPPAEVLGGEPRAEALSYLGAIELIRSRGDSAASALRQLVLHSPRYRPDDVVFPPPVLNLYDQIRRDTKVVEPVAPDSATVQIGDAGGGTYRLTLYASSSHQISATITHGDGRPYRDLYRGPIGDSLELDWDGRDAATAPSPTGRYLLQVESLDAVGNVSRLVQLPLDVELLRRDTLPLPGRPADSLLLPERRPIGPAVRSVVAGVGAGALVAFLPNLLGEGDRAAGVRYGVGVSVGIAGFVGLFSKRPGEALPHNAAANAARMREWQQRRLELIEENRERLRDIRLRVRAQPAVRIEREGS